MVRQGPDKSATGFRHNSVRDLTRVRRCFERVPTGSNKGAKGFRKGTDSVPTRMRRVSLRQLNTVPEDPSDGL